MGFDGLNWRQARALAEKHIKGFQAKLVMYERGFKAVRPDECERYLEIWRGVLQAATPEGWETASLAADEQSEIHDAIICGDYYDLLEGLKEGAT